MKTNWFEDHPVRSIVAYTILVVAAVSAAFVFILDENRVASYRAQVEQYKAKTEVLEIEIARLREENRKYLEWLKESPTSIPYLEKRLSELEKEKLRLQSLVPPGSLGGQVPGTGGSPYFTRQIVLPQGDSYTDKSRGLAVGLARISADFTAAILLTLPGKATESIAQARAGSTWSFATGGKNYLLVLSRVDWHGNKVTFTLEEVVSK